MSIASAVSTFAKGCRHPALLENARLEAGGGEAFGQEAILAHFARHPLDLAEANWVETSTGFAAFAGDRGLFGDLYEGHVARLWRLDPVAGETPEPAVSVPFDPDLVQSRQDVFARKGDHEGLSDNDLAALVVAGRALLAPRDGEAPPLRSRAWLLRAVSTKTALAGLFATHIVGDEAGGRSAGFVFAAALIAHTGGPMTLIRDDAGEAQRLAATWRPRLAP